MRIAWFSPFAAGSAVARFSARMIGALQAIGHELTVVRLDEAGDGAPEWDGPMLSWRRWAEIGEVDAIVYNVGDSFADYGPVYDLAKRRRGIILCHDAGLERYFADYFALIGPSMAAAAPLSAIERMAAETIGAVAFDGRLAELLRSASPTPVLHMTMPQDDVAAHDGAVRLMRFIGETARADPLLHLSRQLGDRLHDMGVLRGDPLAARVAAAVTALFPVTCRRSADADPL